MITVISKHLGLFHERWPIPDEDYLGAIHYIEQIRYKGSQFQHLCTSNINAPVGFSPGIDVSGEELNHLYSSMIIWFELESFIKTGKSFLDHLWRLIAQNHPEINTDNNLKNQKYISQAFNELKKKDHKFKASKAYEAINNSLNIWGRYLVGFRNYIEYSEPLGGMLSSVAGRIEVKVENSITTKNVILPDSFPHYKENKKAFQFTFNSGIGASGFLLTIVKNIDDVFPLIVSEIHNKSLQRTGWGSVA